MLLFKRLLQNKNVIAMKACHSEQKFNEVEFAKNPFIHSGAIKHCNSENFSSKNLTLKWDSSPLGLRMTVLGLRMAVLQQSLKK